MRYGKKAILLQVNMQPLDIWGLGLAEISKRDTAMGSYCCKIFDNEADARKSFG